MNSLWLASSCFVLGEEPLFGVIPLPGFLDVFIEPFRPKQSLNDRSDHHDRRAAFHEPIEYCRRQYPFYRAGTSLGRRSPARRSESAPPNRFSRKVRARCSKAFEGGQTPRGSTEAGRGRSSLRLRCQQSPQAPAEHPGFRLIDAPARIEADLPRLLLSIDKKRMGDQSIPG